MSRVTLSRAGPSVSSWKSSRISVMGGCLASAFTSRGSNTSTIIGATTAAREIDSSMVGQALRMASSR